MEKVYTNTPVPALWGYRCSACKHEVARYEARFFDVKIGAYGNDYLKTFMCPKCGSLQVEVNK